MSINVKIILTVVASLIFLSLIADVIVASWLPSLAVLSAMAVAGFFTGINLLVRGQEKPVANKSRKTK